MSAIQYYRFEVFGYALRAIKLECVTDIDNIFKRIKSLTKIIYLSSSAFLRIIYVLPLVYYYLVNK